MTAALTRRSILGGAGASFAQLLLSRPLRAAARVNPGTAQPGSLDLSLTAITPEILRISIAPNNAPPAQHELGVLESNQAAPLEQGTIGSAATISWGRYSIRLREDPLRIAVTDATQQLRQEIQFDTDSTAVRFRIGNAPLFGLGEGVHPLDRRGTSDPMINGQHSPDLAAFGTRVPIPWLLSLEGWGIFIGQPFGMFDLTGETGIVRSPVATSTRNVYLLLGDTPSDLLRAYADLTGYPHLPPLWALGYQQSHRTLASRDEVLGIAQTFREKNLPCDALIYLGTGFCPSGWNTGHGSFTFNANVFPDPQQMFDELHRQNFHVALHVVPPYDFHGTVTDIGSAAESPGDAAPHWAKHLPVEDAGADGWWPDEGDLLPVDARFERNQMYWDGPLQAHPDRRPFALHRNAYAGVQRFGWIWSGDIDSAWKTLAAQVTNGINVGLCGIPYWGTDTGGFVPTEELTPELYVRWFQFSAFCPLFRSHGRAWKLRLPWGWNLGTPGPLEGAEHLANWPPAQDLHNPEVEGICRKYLELRYQLLPYLYSTVDQAHRTGLPVMRALCIAFPRDAQAALLDDQYMWGDHLLVSPVVEQGATQRSTYLPAGSWWDFWTNERVEGNGRRTRNIDLAILPLYVRAGAIIPMGPVRQYAAQPSDEPVTLRIYPGASGRFSWYEDDGISFRYRNGEFTRIECSWDDNTRNLTLSYDPQGRTLPGRKVRIQRIGVREEKIVTLGRDTAVFPL